MRWFAMLIFPAFIGSLTYPSVKAVLWVVQLPIPGGLVQSNSLIRLGDGEY